MIKAVWVSTYQVLGFADTYMDSVGGRGLGIYTGKQKQNAPLAPRSPLSMPGEPPLSAAPLDMATLSGPFDSTLPTQKWWGPLGVAQACSPLKGPLPGSQEDRGVLKPKAGTAQGCGQFLPN